MFTIETTYKVVSMRPLLATLAILSLCSMASAVGTTFTYQGQINDGGTPVNGTISLRFELIDDRSTRVGTIIRSDVTVQSGLINEDLDFGNVFDGTDYRLRFSYDLDGTANGESFIAASGLIPIRPTPYSVYAEDANRAVLADNVVGGIDDADANPANELNTSVTLNGSVLEIVDAGGTQSADLSSLQAASRIPISSVPFTISQSGSYYFTQNLVNSSSTADGITINADNVSVDMNGFSLDGAGIGDDGVFVNGLQKNIIFKNGHITNWRDVGFNGFSLDDSQLLSLTVSDNGGQGVIVNNRNLLQDIVSNNNSQVQTTDAGIEGDDHNMLINCISSNNTDDGFFLAEKNTLENCKAIGNGRSGFDIGLESFLKDCVASDNVQDGFQIGNRGKLESCHATTNGFNGFNFTIGVSATNCKAVNNGAGTTIDSFENGFRLGSDSSVVDCEAFGSIGGSGFRLEGSDIFVDSCIAKENTRAGFETRQGTMNNATTGNFIIRCIASSTGNSFDIAGGNDAGPIIFPNGTLSSTQNHPYANFSY